MAPRGPSPGVKFCDFIAMFQFLARFEKAPLNLHKMVHGKPHFGDHKKVSRYLEYAKNLKFLEIGFIDRETPRKPGYRILYYQLTEEGRQLLAFARSLSVLRVFISPEFYVTTDRRGKYPAKEKKKEKLWVIEIDS